MLVRNQKWDYAVVGHGDHKNGLFGFFFFRGWTLKLNTSDSLREPSYGLLAMLMETSFNSLLPSREGSAEDWGKMRMWI